jgi:ABC-type lipoprotein export system ATPase subunit
MLNAENIHKTYIMRHKTITVLNGANLKIKPGESVAIIGLSGSGKTTLLHILGGLDKPDQGEVFIDNKSIYKLSEAKRSNIRANEIGFIFQAYHLLQEMTVLENVMLPAMVHGNLWRKASEITDHAMSLLTTVGLENRSTHMPLELSGGEQQRVAMARALMNKPKIILADEPTGNLDNKTGAQVLNTLFDMTTKQNNSLIMVTHNSEIAAKCNRVLRIQDGLIIAEA